MNHSVADLYVNFLSRDGISISKANLLTLALVDTINRNPITFDEYPESRRIIYDIKVAKEIYDELNDGILTALRAPQSL